MEDNYNSKLLTLGLLSSSKDSIPKTVQNPLWIVLEQDIVGCLLLTYRYPCSVDLYLPFTTIRRRFTIVSFKTSDMRSYPPNKLQIPPTCQNIYPRGDFSLYTSQFYQHCISQ